MSAGCLEDGCVIGVCPVPSFGVLRSGEAELGRRRSDHGAGEGRTSAWYPKTASEASEAGVLLECAEPSFVGGSFSGIQSSTTGDNG